MRSEGKERYSYSRNFRQAQAKTVLPAPSTDKEALEAYILKVLGALEEKGPQEKP